MSLPTTIFPADRFIGPSTADQRALALEHTEQTLKDVRNLIVKLDLPLTCMHDALEIYGMQLGGIMGRATFERNQARSRKIVRIASARLPMPITPALTALPSEFDYELANELGLMTDDELDAELAKINLDKRS